MRARTVRPGEPPPMIEVLASAAAMLVGCLAVVAAVCASLVPVDAARYWFSALMSVVAALSLVGAFWLARFGHSRWAAGLLVAVLAVRIVVETTAAAPYAYMLLWPLYLVPIVVAQVLVGSRAGILTGCGAILMFGLTYLALTGQPVSASAPVSQIPLVIGLNVFLYLAAGALVHVALMQVRVTAREAKQVAESHDRARTKLREREEQFQALAENSATGIVIQQDGRLVYGNPTFFEMARCLSSDGFGLSLWDFFDEPGVSELQAQLKRRRTLTSNVPGSLLAFKPLKGDTRWCEVAVAEAMFWEKPAIVANVVDVTTRVQAQMEVQRERDFSNNIIDTAEAVVMALDAEGRVLRFNPAGERLTGYSFTELRGQPYWDVIASPELQSDARAMYDDIRLGLRHGHREATWLSKTGEELIISWHYVGQYAGEELTGLVCIGIDVTQQRILERQAMVTERLRSLGQIAGGVAHDLNNMLAGIIGPADLLMLQEDDSGKQRILNGILAAATRGAETVRRIQSFSKARTEVDKQVFDLRELAEDVIFSLRPRWRDAAQRQGIRIDVKDSVPPGLMVHASSGEIGNVLMNLIVNACEAMPHDGQIEIRGRQDQELIEFQVADTGMGMSAETMANIFQPFFSTKGADNSGLGLAVIHGIILRHGGTITVDSEPGQGTTFSVTLPASMPEEAPEDHAAAGRTPGERLRILVVDDVPEIADYIAMVADRVGHDATAVHSGEAAAQRLQQEQFDALITDYGMEGTSGLQLAEKARRLHPAIKLVLVTGWDMSLQEIEGFSGLLKKPCTRGQVEEMLHSLTVTTA